MAVIRFLKFNMLIFYSFRESTFGDSHKLKPDYVHVSASTGGHY